MHLILDNGHGLETPGKRSPDGRIIEAAYTRELARDLAPLLRAAGHQVHLLVPTNADISINERVNRANDFYRSYVKGTAEASALISLHLNASTMGGQWGKAHGWSVFVGYNASERSRELATAFVDTATSEAFGFHTRRYSYTQPYWVQTLGICQRTLMPAVLTENFFMDNQEDTAFLLSPQGRQQLLKLYTTTIAKIAAKWK